MTDVVIILGGANDKKGNLSSISKERLNRGFKEYQKRKDCKVMLTGGFGKNFNITKKAHATYGKNYLLDKGVKRKDFLKIARSKNAVEDALLSKKILHGVKVRCLVVVTSDFHLKRVKFIFRRIFDRYDLKFLRSKTKLSAEKLKHLKKHEVEALSELKENENKRFVQKKKEK